MSNTKKLYILVALAAVSILSEFVEFPWDGWVSYGCSLLSTLLGAYLLIANSNIRSTPSWKIICFAIAVLILGALFKILHVVGADELMLIGYAGMVITYLIRFIRKRSINHLDVLKLLTVLSYGVISSLIIVHAVSREYGATTTVFFWATIIDFAYLERRKTSSPSQKR